jgi:hypothetical protein
VAEFKTRDVSLAAYIRFRGHDLIRYQVVENKRTRRKEGEWVFNLTSMDARQLKVDYANSDIAAFEGIRRGMSKQKYS